MAQNKVKDLVVKFNEYTTKTGEKKKATRNIGGIFEGQYGQYILLDRTFNLASVPNPDDRDTVMVSIYDVKENATGVNAGTSHQNAGFVDMECDVPF